CGVTPSVSTSGRYAESPITASSRHRVIALTVSAPVGAGSLMTSRSTSRASCELTENYALQVQGKGMPAAPNCYRLQRCLVICTELQHRTALSLSPHICIDSFGPASHCEP